jgi:hypothetical protein
MTAPLPRTDPERAWPPTAGASARRTFERRHERHRADVRRRRPLILVVGAVWIAVGLGVVVAGPVLPSYAPISGWVVVLGGAGWTAKKLFVTPQHIDSWDSGAIGEEATARYLSDLPPAFIVLHDRRIPESRANIDHIVVGPTGVFVIETKRYIGRLTVKRDEVYVAGRRKTAIVDQADHEAAIVADVLERSGTPMPVAPILCIHKAGLPWRRASVRGVAIVSGARLTKAITTLPATLDSATVSRLAAALDRALPPA